MSATTNLPARSKLVSLVPGRRITKAVRRFSIWTRDPNTDEPLTMVHQTKRCTPHAARLTGLRVARRLGCFTAVCW